MAQIIDVVMRLTDNVTSGLTRIRAGMEQTAKANQRMGRDLENAGRHVGNLSNALMPLAAGITGVGAMGVKTFMDFDATITAAGVKAGATAAEMQKMKDAAAAMGAKFPTTARAVAEGMDRLAAGGFNANQTIGAMPGIIEASVASGEDLATTSNVITSALSIWNLKNGDIASNTRHVADVVQAAANASKLGMQDFGLAMQYAGAPAAALGVSIEELGTAMGIMSNNGIEASTIGTSLRSTLTRLASPPKAAAAALKQLGISAADLHKGDGSFIGLAGAVDLLRSRMSGLSDVEQVAALKAIAGEDAYSGLLALIKTSPAAYKQMADTIANSSGSSHAAYMQMQNTLKGSIDALMSSVEAMMISFGSALAPTIRSVATSLKGIADTFTRLSPGTKQMIIHIGEAIVAFTAFTFATSKVLTFSGAMVKTLGDVERVMHGNAVANKALQYGVQGVMKGFSLLKAAGTALLGPWGIVIAAIALAAFYIYKNWDTIGPFFVKLWNGIKNAFTGAVNSISPALDGLRNAWGTLTSSFQNGTGVMCIIKNLAELISNIFSGELYAGIVLVSAVISGTLTAAFNVIAAVVNTVIGVFSGLINFITGVFTGDWSLAWKGVVQVFSSIFGGVKGIVDGILGGIKASVNTVIDGINNISFTVPSWVPDIGGTKFSPNIPKLATGTDFWRGGPVIINDAGGEIVDLPEGSRVMPHDKSVSTAYQMGARSRTDGITVNIIGTTINNGTDVKELARKVAERIHFEMEKEAINSMVGGI